MIEEYMSRRDAGDAVEGLVYEAEQAVGLLREIEGLRRDLDRVLGRLEHRVAGIQETLELMDAGLRIGPKD